MTAAELLKALRAKGYTVTLMYNMTVTATGPTPKDPVKAAALLKEHEDGLAHLLVAEQKREVRDAVEVLGATLIRATGCELVSGETE